MQNLALLVWMFHLFWLALSLSAFVVHVVFVALSVAAVLFFLKRMNPRAVGAAAQRSTPTNLSRLARRIVVCAVAAQALALPLPPQRSSSSSTLGCETRAASSFSSDPNSSFSHFSPFSPFLRGAAAYCTGTIFGKRVEQPTASGVFRGVGCKVAQSLELSAASSPMYDYAAAAADADPMAVRVEMTFEKGSVDSAGAIIIRGVTSSAACPRSTSGSARVPFVCLVSDTSFGSNAAIGVSGSFPPNSNITVLRNTIRGTQANLYTDSTSGVATPLYIGVSAGDAYVVVCPNTTITIAENTLNVERSLIFAVGVAFGIELKGHFRFLPLSALAIVGNDISTDQSVALTGLLTSYEGAAISYSSAAATSITFAALPLPTSPTDGTAAFSTPYALLAYAARPTAVAGGDSAVPFWGSHRVEWPADEVDESDAAVVSAVLRVEGNTLHSRNSQSSLYSKTCSALSLPPIVDETASAALLGPDGSGGPAFVSPQEILGAAVAAGQLSVKLIFRPMLLIRGNTVVGFADSANRAAVFQIKSVSFPSAAAYALPHAEGIYAQPRLVIDGNSVATVSAEYFLAIESAGPILIEGRGRFAVTGNSFSSSGGDHLSVSLTDVTTVGGAAFFTISGNTFFSSGAYAAASGQAGCVTTSKAVTVRDAASFAVSGNTLDQSNRAQTRKPWIFLPNSFVLQTSPQWYDRQPTADFCGNVKYGAAFRGAAAVLALQVTPHARRGRQCLSATHSIEQTSTVTLSLTAVRTESMTISDTAPATISSNFVTGTVLAFTGSSSATLLSTRSMTIVSTSLTLSNTVLLTFTVSPAPTLTAPSTASATVTAPTPSLSSSVEAPRTRTMTATVTELLSVSPSVSASASLVPNAVPHGPYWPEAVASGSRFFARFLVFNATNETLSLLEGAALGFGCSNNSNASHAFSFEPRGAEAVSPIAALLADLTEGAVSGQRFTVRAASAKSTAPLRLSVAQPALRFFVAPNGSAVAAGVTEGEGGGGEVAGTPVWGGAEVSAPPLGDGLPPLGDCLRCLLLGGSAACSACGVNGTGSNISFSTSNGGGNLSPWHSCNATAIVASSRCASSYGRHRPWLAVGVPSSPMGGAQGFAARAAAFDGLLSESPDNDSLRSLRSWGPSAASRFVYGPSNVGGGGSPQISLTAYFSSRNFSDTFRGLSSFGANTSLAVTPSGGRGCPLYGEMLASAVSYDSLGYPLCSTSGPTPTAGRRGWALPVAQRSTTLTSATSLLPNFLQTVAVDADPQWLREALSSLQQQQQGGGGGATSTIPFSQSALTAMGCAAYGMPRPYPSVFATASTAAAASPLFTGVAFVRSGYGPSSLSSPSYNYGPSSSLFFRPVRKMLKQFVLLEREGALEGAGAANAYALGVAALGRAIAAAGGDNRSSSSTSSSASFGALLANITNEFLLASTPSIGGNGSAAIGNYTNFTTSARLFHVHRVTPSAVLVGPLGATPDGTPRSAQLPAAKHRIVALATATAAIGRRAGADGEGGKGGGSGANATAVVDVTVEHSAAIRIAAPLTLASTDPSNGTTASSSSGSLNPATNRLGDAVLCTLPPRPTLASLSRLSLPPGASLRRALKRFVGRAIAEAYAAPIAAAKAAGGRFFLEMFSDAQRKDDDIYQKMAAVNNGGNNSNSSGVIGSLDGFVDAVRSLVKSTISDIADSSSAQAYTATNAALLPVPLTPSSPSANAYAAMPSTALRPFRCFAYLSMDDAHSACDALGPACGGFSTVRMRRWEEIPLCLYGPASAASAGASPASTYAPSSVSSVGGVGGTTSGGYSAASVDDAVPYHRLFYVKASLVSSLLSSIAADGQSAATAQLRETTGQLQKQQQQLAEMLAAPTPPPPTNASTSSLAMTVALRTAALSVWRGAAEAIAAEEGPTCAVPVEASGAIAVFVQQTALLSRRVIVKTNGGRFAASCGGSAKFWGASVLAAGAGVGSATTTPLFGADGKCNLWVLCYTGKIRANSTVSVALVPSEADEAGGGGDPDAVYASSSSSSSSSGDAQLASDQMGELVGDFGCENSFGVIIRQTAVDADQNAPQLPLEPPAAAFDLSTFGEYRDINIQSTTIGDSSSSFASSSSAATSTASASAQQQPQQRSSVESSSRAVTVRLLIANATRAAFDVAQNAHSCETFDYLQRQRSVEGSSSSSGGGGAFVEEQCPASTVALFTSGRSRCQSCGGFSKGFYSGRRKGLSDACDLVRDGGVEDKGDGTTNDGDTEGGSRNDKFSLFCGDRPLVLSPTSATTSPPSSAYAGDSALLASSSGVCADTAPPTIPSSGTTTLSPNPTINTAQNLQPFNGYLSVAVDLGGLAARAPMAACGRSGLYGRIFAERAAWAEGEGETMTSPPLLRLPTAFPLLNTTAQYAASGQFRTLIGRWTAGRGAATASSKAIGALSAASAPPTLAIPVLAGATLPPPPTSSPSSAVNVAAPTPRPSLVATVGPTGSPMGAHYMPWRSFVLARLLALQSAAIAVASSSPSPFYDAAGRPATPEALLINAAVLLLSPPNSTAAGGVSGALASRLRGGDDEVFAIITDPEGIWGSSGSASSSSSLVPAPTLDPLRFANSGGTASHYERQQDTAMRRLIAAVGRGGTIGGLLQPPPPPSAPEDGTTSQSPQANASSSDALWRHVHAAIGPNASQACLVDFGNEQPARCAFAVPRGATHVRVYVAQSDFATPPPAGQKDDGDATSGGSSSTSSNSGAFSSSTTVPANTVTVTVSHGAVAFSSNVLVDIAAPSSGPNSVVDRCGGADAKKFGFDRGATGRCDQYLACTSRFLFGRDGTASTDRSAPSLSDLVMTRPPPTAIAEDSRNRGIAALSSVVVVEFPPSLRYSGCSLQAVAVAEFSEGQTAPVTAPPAPPQDPNADFSCDSSPNQPSNGSAATVPMTLCDGERRCIPNSRICDGVQDCFTNMDERMCGAWESIPDERFCLPSSVLPQEGEGTEGNGNGNNVFWLLNITVPAVNSFEECRREAIARGSGIFSVRKNTTTAATSPTTATALCTIYSPSFVEAILADPASYVCDGVSGEDETFIAFPEDGDGKLSFGLCRSSIHCTNRGTIKVTPTTTNASSSSTSPLSSSSSPSQCECECEPGYIGATCGERLRLDEMTQAVVVIDVSSRGRYPKGPSGALANSLRINRLALAKALEMRWPSSSVDSGGGGGGDTAASSSTSLVNNFHVSASCGNVIVPLNSTAVAVECAIVSTRDRPLDAYAHYRRLLDPLNVRPLNAMLALLLGETDAETEGKGGGGGISGGAETLPELPILYITSRTVMNPVVAMPVCEATSSTSALCTVNVPLDGLLAKIADREARRRGEIESGTKARKSSTGRSVGGGNTSLANVYKGGNPLTYLLSVGKDGRSASTADQVFYYSPSTALSVFDKLRFVVQRNVTASAMHVRALYADEAAEAAEGDGIHSSGRRQSAFSTHRHERLGGEEMWAAAMADKVPPILYTSTAGADSPTLKPILSSSEFGHHRRRPFVNPLYNFSRGGGNTSYGGGVGEAAAIGYACATAASQEGSSSCFVSACEVPTRPSDIVDDEGNDADDWMGTPRYDDPQYMYTISVAQISAIAASGEGSSSGGAVVPLLVTITGIAFAPEDLFTAPCYDSYAASAALDSHGNAATSSNVTARNDPATYVPYMASGIALLAGGALFCWAAAVLLWAWYRAEVDAVMARIDFAAIARLDEAKGGGEGEGGSRGRRQSVRAIVGTSSRVDQKEEEEEEEEVEGPKRLEGNAAATGAIKDTTRGFVFGERRRSVSNAAPRVAFVDDSEGPAHVKHTARRRKSIGRGDGDEGLDDELPPGAWHQRARRRSSAAMAARRKSDATDLSRAPSSSGASHTSSSFSSEHTTTSASSSSSLLRTKARLLGLLYFFGGLHHRRLLREERRRAAVTSDLFVKEKGEEGGEDGTQLLVVSASGGEARAMVVTREKEEEDSHCVEKKDPLSRIARVRRTLLLSEAFAPLRRRVQRPDRCSVAFVIAGFALAILSAFLLLYYATSYALRSNVSVLYEEYSDALCDLSPTAYIPTRLFAVPAGSYKCAAMTSTGESVGTTFATGNCFGAGGDFWVNFQSGFSERACERAEIVTARSAAASGNGEEGSWNSDGAAESNSLAVGGRILNLPSGSCIPLRHIDPSHSSAQRTAYVKLTCSAAGAIEARRALLKQLTTTPDVFVPMVAVEPPEAVDFFSNRLKTFTWRESETASMADASKGTLGAAAAGAVRSNTAQSGVDEDGEGDNNAFGRGGRAFADAGAEDSKYTSVDDNANAATVVLLHDEDEEGSDALTGAGVVGEHDAGEAEYNRLLFTATAHTNGVAAANIRTFARQATSGDGGENAATATAGSGGDEVSASTLARSPSGNLYYRTAYAEGATVRFSTSHSSTSVESVAYGGLYDARAGPDAERLVFQDIGCTFRPTRAAIGARGRRWVEVDGGHSSGNHYADDAAKMLVPVAVSNGCERLGDALRRVYPLLGTSNAADPFTRADLEAFAPNPNLRAEFAHTDAPIGTLFNGFRGPSVPTSDALRPPLLTSEEESGESNELSREYSFASSSFSYSSASSSSGTTWVGAGFGAHRYYGIKDTIFDIGNYFPIDPRPNGPADGTDGYSISLYLKADASTRGFAYAVCDAFEEIAGGSSAIHPLDRLAQIIENGLDDSHWLASSHKVYHSLYVNGPGAALVFAYASPTAGYRPQNPRVAVLRFDLAAIGAAHVLNGLWHHVAITFGVENGNAKAHLIIDGESSYARPGWSKCMGGDGGGDGGGGDSSNNGFFSEPVTEVPTDAIPDLGTQVRNARIRRAVADAAATSAATAAAMAASAAFQERRTPSPPNTTTAPVFDVKKDRVTRRGMLVVGYFNGGVYGLTATPSALLSSAFLYTGTQAMRDHSPFPRAATLSLGIVLIVAAAAALLFVVCNGVRDRRRIGQARRRRDYVEVAEVYYKAMAAVRRHYKALAHNQRIAAKEAKRALIEALNAEGRREAAERQWLEAYNRRLAAAASAVRYAPTAAAVAGGAHFGDGVKHTNALSASVRSSSIVSGAGELLPRLPFPHHRRSHSTPPAPITTQQAMGAGSFAALRSLHMNTASSTSRSRSSTSHYPQQPLPSSSRSFAGWAAVAVGDNRLPTPAAALAMFGDRYGSGRPNVNGHSSSLGTTTNTNSAPFVSGGGVHLSTSAANALNTNSTSNSGTSRKATVPSPAYHPVHAFAAGVSGGATSPSPNMLAQQQHVLRRMNGGDAFGHTPDNSAAGGVSGGAVVGRFAGIGAGGTTSVTTASSASAAASPQFYTLLQQQQQQQHHNNPYLPPFNPQALPKAAVPAGGWVSAGVLPGGVSTSGASTGPILFGGLAPPMATPRSGDVSSSAAGGGLAPFVQPYAPQHQQMLGGLPFVNPNVYTTNNYTRVTGGLPFLIAAPPAEQQHTFGGGGGAEEYFGNTNAPPIRSTASPTSMIMMGADKKKARRRSQLAASVAHSRSLRRTNTMLSLAGGGGGGVFLDQSLAMPAIIGEEDANNANAAAAMVDPLITFNFAEEARINPFLYAYGHFHFGALEAFNQLQQQQLQAPPVLPPSPEASSTSVFSLYCEEGGNARSPQQQPRIQAPQTTRPHNTNSSTEHRGHRRRQKSSAAAASSGDLYSSQHNNDNGGFIMVAAASPAALGGGCGRGWHDEDEEDEEALRAWGEAEDSLLHGGGLLGPAALLQHRQCSVRWRRARVGGGGAAHGASSSGDSDGDGNRGLDTNDRAPLMRLRTGASPNDDDVSIGTNGRFLPTSPSADHATGRHRHRRESDGTSSSVAAVFVSTSAANTPSLIPAIATLTAPPNINHYTSDGAATTPMQGKFQRLHRRHDDDHRHTATPISADEEPIHVPAAMVAAPVGAHHYPMGGAAMRMGKVMGMGGHESDASAPLFAGLTKNTVVSFELSHEEVHHHGDRLHSSADVSEAPMPLRTFSGAQPHNAGRVGRGFSIQRSPNSQAPFGAAYASVGSPTSASSSEGGRAMTRTSSSPTSLRSKRSAAALSQFGGASTSQAFGLPTILVPPSPSAMAALNNDAGPTHPTNNGVAAPMRAPRADSPRHELLPHGYGHGYANASPSPQEQEQQNHYMYHHRITPPSPRTLAAPPLGKGNAFDCRVAGAEAALRAAAGLTIIDGGDDEGASAVRVAYASAASIDSRQFMAASPIDHEANAGASAVPPPFASSHHSSSGRRGGFPVPLPTIGHHRHSLHAHMRYVVNAGDDVNGNNNMNMNVNNNASSNSGPIASYMHHHHPNINNNNNRSTGTIINTANTSAMTVNGGGEVRVDDAYFSWHYENHNKRRRRLRPLRFETAMRWAGLETPQQFRTLLDELATQTANPAEQLFLTLCEAREAYLAKKLKISGNGREGGGGNGSTAKSAPLAEPMPSSMAAAVSNAAEAGGGAAEVHIEEAVAGAHVAEDVEMQRLRPPTAMTADHHHHGDDGDAEEGDLAIGVDHSLYSPRDASPAQ